MTGRQPAVSVIIPTLNEQEAIAGLLDHLRELGFEEIIVADGGSDDRTVELVSGKAKLVRCQANRGAQLNEGARHVTGEILLFLHADVRLGNNALGALRAAMNRPDVVGGDFDVHYEGVGLASKVFTVANRVRRRFGIFYGDSGIFCRRTAFDRLGGYRPYPILEDYDFVRRLRQQGELVLLDEPVLASARRWRHSSLPGTLWSWFCIQSLYLLGVSPYRLARMYRNVR